MKDFIKKIPIFGNLARELYWRLNPKATRPKPFLGSYNYWEERYSSGGNSGLGSYNQLAEFKATIINDFVARNNIHSILEFGCGDGNQLTLAKYSTYLGFDVSSTAISKCQQLFGGDNSKQFRLMSEYLGEKGDVTLSLDVIYHLIEDDVFEAYMQTLFAAANQYVIIYASDSVDNRGYEGTHVRHRKFIQWVQQNCPAWKLSEHIPNKYPYRGDDKQGSFADFFIYAKA